MGREVLIYMLDRLQQAVGSGHQVVVSAITYAELRFGAASKRASPKMAGVVTEFIERLDGVLAWDKAAVETSTSVKTDLASRGRPIGHNDTLIAGHAIATGARLVPDNLHAFSRVTDLQCENWVVRDGT